MKPIKEYLINESNQSLEEKIIKERIKLLYSDVHFTKEYVNDYITGKADKVDKDHLYEIELISNGLPYKILKNESLYEIIVKCMFKEIFRKVHIKSEDAVLSQIWEKYKNEWIEKIKQCLSEREKFMKECPEYYKMREEL